jgi:hypothetical protein
MNEESKNNQTPPPEKPDWLAATPDDLSSIDLNGPISNSSTIDCSEISDLYRKCAEDSKNGDRSAEYRVYSMISAITSFHFKPNERNEPFGPLFQMGDRRSAIPEDFRGAPERVLLDCAKKLQNPALSARINDVLWLFDRSRAESGQSALKGYLDTVRAVRDGKATFRFEEKEFDSHLCEEQLRRALYIARAIGWEKEISQEARALVAEARKCAFENKHLSGFHWFAELDLDFEVSESVTVAREAESLAKIEVDLHRQHHFWMIAARGFAHAKVTDDQSRCRAAAAECLVKVSEQGSASAMFEAHWLEQAITELHRVRGTQDRRKELKHRLVEVQSRIPEEMSSFSHEMDRSEIARHAREAVANKSSFFSALGSFVRLGFSPTPDELEKEARESIEEHPLQAIFSGVIMDSHGKPVHRYGGLDESSGENSAIQQQIVQSESIRRNLMVSSIESARLAIMSQYHVGAENLALLCRSSPFIPPGHANIYMIGFGRFFQGEMTGALHILVPQLENSIRHVLRSNGYDVTKLNNDMTQEDINLSAILERMRPEMNKVFTPRFVTDIDNVFNHRGGPSIRHLIAHGQLPDGAFFSADAIYACWFILQLCSLPLFQHWDELTARYESK